MTLLSFIQESAKRPDRIGVLCRELLAGGLPQTTREIKLHLKRLAAIHPEKKQIINILMDLFYAEKTKKAAR